MQEAAWAVAEAEREEILEPTLPIVDPHHHLWDSLVEVGDLKPPRHPFGYVVRVTPRYLFEELLADVTSGHNVRATIFMQCGAMYRAGGPEHLRVVGETEFVNGVAAMSASGRYGEPRLCAAIVGTCDLRQGSAVEEVLEAQRIAGGGRFRGIRQGGSWNADPDVLGRRGPGAEGLYRRPEFREGFARLAQFGFSFDSWMLEPQLQDLIDLAKAFPDTAVILNHVGTPLGIAGYAGKRAERFTIWRSKIKTLAALPNTYVKLGGLGMPHPGFDSFMARPPASSAQLAAEWGPYVLACIEAFGAERCMFESNFPVDRCSCSYATLWNAFKRIVAAASADEKTALFSGTATKVYRPVL
jgi:predicted TIM-barrel fold metal-dependent hydrolase